VDFQEEERVLGLLSPLARPTSVISINFAGSSNQVPIFQLPETPLGKQYSFRQAPFQSFVELKESLSVTKRNSEYLNKANGGRLEPISADVSSIIMRNRSVGCCSLRNCPMENSVITFSFVEFSMGQQNCTGACLPLRFINIAILELMPLKGKSPVLQYSRLVACSIFLKETSFA